MERGRGREGFRGDEMRGNEMRGLPLQLVDLRSAAHISITLKEALIVFLLL
jgi:hypothetical protein